MARLSGSRRLHPESRAGRADRLGLGADELSRSTRGSSCATCPAMAITGPYATRKPTTCSSRARPGVFSVTGTPGSPSKVGISIADIGTGMYAYSGIPRRCSQRERTGQGQRIEVTMFDSLVEWMGYPLYYTHFGGKAPRRSGPDHATILPYGRFARATAKRHVRHPERARVGGLLRRGARPPGAGDGPAL